MWNKAINYICNNMMKVLTIAFLISLVIPFVYEFTKNMEEWFPHADTAFVIGVNVSYSIIASYLFFLINFHIPNQKKKKDSYDHIGLSLSKSAFNFEKLLTDLNIPHNDSMIEISSVQKALTENQEKKFDLQYISSSILKLPPRLRIAAVIHAFDLHLREVLLHAGYLKSTEKYAFFEAQERRPAIYKNCEQFELLEKIVNYPDKKLIDDFISIEYAHRSLHRSSYLPKELFAHIKKMKVFIYLMHGLTLPLLASPKIKKKPR